MKYLKLLEKLYSHGTPGGMLGYIDQMLHLLNQLDIIDPDCLHHTSHTDQQNISMIRLCCSDIDPYNRITYEYYTKIASEGCFNVDLYAKKITRLCQHIDPQSVNMNPIREYQVDTATTATQAHYAGQDRNPGTPEHKTSGYHNFMFLTKAEFDHMKAHHPELK
jgi:hypothetical protein